MESIKAYVKSEYKQLTEEVAPKNNSLTVSEIFGPTFQGEGPFTGRAAVFLRLGRCNLDCKWCDTPYTWDWKGKNGTVYDPAIELTKMSVSSVRAEVKSLMPTPFTRVVISGGEPMLQTKGLESFVVNMRASMVLHIDIETNGTRSPISSTFLQDDAINYVISPKLKGSGVEWKYKWFDTLKEYKPLAEKKKAFFKFVICDEDDIRQVEELLEAVDWKPEHTWLMPEGRINAELDAHSAKVAEYALTMGANYSDRLHVRLWGDERGR